MKRILKYLKGRKGMTLVYLALLLVVLFMLAGVAIDLTYMYYVKNQLQVATDAAVLAGAARLDGTNSTDQENARETAWEFACKNTAADNPKNVYLVTHNNDPANSIFCDDIPDYTNLNISNNDSLNDDIVIGYWNGNNFSNTIPPNGIANAVRVRARRTESSPGGPVKVFLGKIFELPPVKANWSFMSARASAVAAMPLKANGHLTMCLSACTAIYPAFDTNIRIFKTPPPPMEKSLQFIWTSLTQSPASTPPIIDLICSNTTDADVCDKDIYTNPDSVAFKMFASVFLDPATPKTECPPIPGIICPPGGTGWWLIVPIVEGCDSDLTNASTPKTVINYALIRIINVCATGLSSGGCTNRPPLPPYISGCGPGEKSVTIDRLSCISCSNRYNILGLKPTLVK